MAFLVVILSSDSLRDNPSDGSDLNTSLCSEVLCFNLEGSPHVSNLINIISEHSNDHKSSTNLSVLNIGRRSSYNNDLTSITHIKGRYMHNYL